MTAKAQQKFDSGVTGQWSVLDFSAMEIPRSSSTKFDGAGILSLVMQYSLFTTPPTESKLKNTCSQHFGTFHRFYDVQREMRYIQLKSNYDDQHNTLPLTETTTKQYQSQWHTLTRWKVVWESSTPCESYCGLPPQWGCAVNGTAVAAVLIDQSCSHSSRDRRTTSEAEKLFRLPPTYLGSPTIRLLL